MNNRRLRSPMIYLFELVGLAIVILTARFIFNQMDTSTNTAIAGSNLSSTPTLSAVFATATKVEWARRQTEVPPIDNVWLVTPPAWSKPLPTWPPFTPITEPAPRTLPPQPTNVPVLSNSVSVVSVKELSNASKSQFRSLFSPASFQSDGKTLVGSVQTSSGKMTMVAVDVDTDQLRVLVDGTATSGVPQVSDRYVIWPDQHKLQIYDLQQNQRQEVNVDAQFAQLAGNIVVYQATDNNTSRIKGFDIANQKTFSITDGPGKQILPMISKNWVVFRDSSKTNGSSSDSFYWIALNATNLDTHEQVNLGMIGVSRYAMPSSLYAIDVPWVAWNSGQIGDTTLHLYNLQTRQSSTISLPMCKSRKVPDSNFVSDFRLSNGIVLFKCGDFPWQYLGYAIVQKAFFSIPIQQAKTEDDMLVGWTIMGDRIVWQWYAYADGKGESRIYTAQILVKPNLPYP